MIFCHSLKKVLEQQARPAAPVDPNKVFLPGKKTEIQFFQNREQSARFIDLGMDAFQPKTGFRQMQQIPDHGSAHPFAPMRRIDDEIKRAVVGDFAVRHQIERSDRAGLVLDHSRQTRFEFRKPDPIFKRFFPFGKPERIVEACIGFGKPLIQLGEIVHRRKTVVESL